MKPLDAKSNTYINSSEKINNKDLKSKIGDIVRISKHKKYFCKSLYSKLVWRGLSRGDILLLILMERKLLERVTKKNFKNQLKISLELEKVL